MQLLVDLFSCKVGIHSGCVLAALFHVCVIQSKNNTTKLAFPRLTDITPQELTVLQTGDCFSSHEDKLQSSTNVKC